MIITRTPYRISFFGGGTDYSVWYEKHGGCVLSSTINKACYVTVRELPPFYEHRLRVVYSREESVLQAKDLKNAVVRETLRFIGIKTGYEIHHDGDLPARSGMGSSSAFIVGLLTALTVGNLKDLAAAATHIERNMMGSMVGDQDQIAAAYGGFNVIRFPGNEVTPVQENGLFKKLMLFYTGIQRNSSEVARTYQFDKKVLQRMKAMVDEGVKYLETDHDAFGELLHEGWVLKRLLSKSISNPTINGYYVTALQCGAIGGKILGAGGGGFLLLYVPEERQEEVKDALRLLHVPIKYEPEGSKIIYKEGV